MSTSFKEKILVPYTFADHEGFALTHGTEIARFSNKELNLLHVFGSQEDEQALKSRYRRVVTDLSTRERVSVNGFVLPGEPSGMIPAISERISATMIVMALKPGEAMTGHKLKVLRASRVPYILVHDHPAPGTYKNVVYPIDFSRTVKEKTLWAVYFSKFNQATVHIVVAKKKDHELEPEIKNNLLFTKGTFQRFGVDYKLHVVEARPFDVNDHATQYAQQLGNALMIIMNTRHYGLFDYLFGPQEKKIINNALKIPVMCINSRDDLYVPCV